MAIELQIIAGSALPIFRQIVDQVRLGVATGNLQAGEPLPSVRALAEKLLVNPNTIAKAYTELSRDGVIESIPGKGVFIAQKREIYTKAERLRRIDPLIDSLVQEAVLLGFEPNELIASLRARYEKLSSRRSS